MPLLYGIFYTEYNVKKYNNSEYAGTKSHCEKRLKTY